MPAELNDGLFQDLRMQRERRERERRERLAKADLEKKKRKERDEKWLEELITQAEKQDKDRKEQEEHQLLKRKNELEKREQRQQEREKKRVQEILSHIPEWGDEMCQWLIEHRIEPNTQVTVGIINKLQEWGQDTCQQLLEQKIDIGMTVEMVTVALGVPTTIEERVISAKSETARWVYGMPRQGAIYVWFKSGRVVKIRR